MSLIFYVLLSSIIFLVGVFGVILNRKNILLVIMSIELMLLSINFNFVVYSVIFDDLVGQIFSLFVVTVAAAESAIGLAIIVAHYHIAMSISVEKIKTLKG
jgi:NADH-quinone oxidoreductase subunit K